MYTRPMPSDTAPAVDFTAIDAARAARGRVVWAMAAMNAAQLAEMVALAEKLAPASAMSTTFTGEK